MISLIVPLYNEGELVFELVDHLDGLSGFSEIILVDASDQQTSKQALEELEQKRLDSRQKKDIRILHSERPGRAAQMNLGARYAGQSTLLFLHCDTRLPDDAATQITASLDEQTCWGRFDVRLDHPGWIYRLIGAMINLRSRFRRLATGDQGIFVKRDDFEKVGGFPDIAIMEDIAISRLLNRRSPPALIGQPVLTSARRWRRAGTVKTILLMWKLRFLFWMGVSPDRLVSMYHNVR